MRHKFQIKSEWTEKGEETHAYLDDERIFTVDKTLYAGVARRDNEGELCKILTEKLGRDITPRELSTARMLESIDDDPEE